MEPSDIATHSIQFCMDSLLNVSHSPPGKGGVVKDETGWYREGPVATGLTIIWPCVGL